ncbi:hypothetical protein IVB41_08915 [Bradyrhizobium sp. 44]|uniref:hypothetical protein n=1 Tax=Bradyrhizobium sp. 44 TaxID=2782675 RepID=UPI001FF9AD92|nr:hypothetical protein [Bradyrhizobium sp. 44]MCK1284058.1 hypothetical protein [Bradyrhizobium sp. 44]
MTAETNFAKAPGKQRRMYLARCFGSTDGTVRGVADKWDRKRLLARYTMEAGYSALWESDELRFCETAADLEAAKTRSHHSLCVLEAWHRKALKRSALLHAGEMKSFLEPFGENDQMPMDQYCAVGSNHESAVSAMRSRVPESRVRYVSYRAWSPDETPENVPDEWKPWFAAEMEYQQQAYEQSLENICRHYGSESGKPAEIPSANHPAAACYWRRWQARQEMKARFEYDLYVIAANEMAAEGAAQALTRAGDDATTAAEQAAEAVRALGFG